MKDRPVLQIGAVAGQPRQLVHEVAERVLLLLRQMQLVGKLVAAEMEAQVQIRLFGTEGSQKIRMDFQHEAFVDRPVQLREIMAFILIDEENITRLDIIEPVVDQELLPAGNGVIDLIAVMDVHVHGLVVVIQMGYGEAFRFQTGLDGKLAGTEFFMGKPVVFLL